MSNYEQLFNQYNPNLGQFVEEARELIDDEKKSMLYTEIEELTSRYYGHEEFCSGGMKKILKVRDESTARIVAMAMLRNDPNHYDIEAFLREARITSQLQHPNIVPVYDIGIDDKEMPFFTMKLIEGETLESVISKLHQGGEEYKSVYTLPFLVDVLIKLCEATAYAHSKGILHLDLKPANVQVSNFGEVLLCDWGLATIMDEVCEYEDVSRYSISAYDLKNNTIAGFIKGSLGFLAPEQAGMFNGRKDERTDVYALGMILYSLLTYRRAISTSNLEEYLKKCINGDVVPPSLRCPNYNIPRGLEAICMKAIEVNPVDRYRSVNLLLNDLHAYTSGYATSAQNAGFFTHAKLLVTRHRAVSLTVLGAAAVIVALVATFIGDTIMKEQIAQHERAKAEKALIDLKSEQEKTKELSKSSAERFYLKAVELYDLYKHDEALNQLDAALLLKPDDKSAGTLKAELLFVRGDISASEQNYKKMKIDVPAVVAIGKLFEPSLKQGATVENLKPYFAALSKSVDKKLTKRTMYYLGRTIEDPEQRYELTLFVLSIDYPKFNQDKLKYDSVKKSLEYTNDRRLKSIEAFALLDIESLVIKNTLIKDIDILRVVRPKYLDCSYTPVSTIEPLEGIHMDYLDVSGSRIDSIPPIDQILVKHLNISRNPIRQIGRITRKCTLEKLIVGDRQLTKAQAEEFSKYMEVERIIPPHLRHGGNLRLGQTRGRGLLHPPGQNQFGQPPSGELHAPNQGLEGQYLPGQLRQRQLRPGEYGPGLPPGHRGAGQLTLPNGEQGESQEQQRDGQHPPLHSEEGYPRVPLYHQGPE